MYIKQKLQEQFTLVEKKKRLQAEALDTLGENHSGEKAYPSIDELKTTDIESEEMDIFDRRKNFEELQKRFETHSKEKSYLKGNDLRYNIYMRKMNKLTRMDLGLDMEAYKDYLNNLKYFAHLKNDYQLFAQEDMKID